MPSPEQLELSVSEFVALLNQTLEYAYPSVMVVGELANFRISKNRWLYFDLKDEEAIVRCFGTVYALPGPLEDGMLVKVTSQPRLHPLYGFSLNIISIQPSGEGSIKKAASLLEAKLAAEGLFAPERKRVLPYPPARIGLVTSAESAAYSDFIKVIGERWGGVSIELADVQVQGETAAEQIVEAITIFDQKPLPPEVVVLIRGGGSAEDLQAFSAEQVVRAVAASRIPSLVAIGHERDVSLAELAADRRASTPSNAAELLVPDRRYVLAQLQATSKQLKTELTQKFEAARQDADHYKDELFCSVELAFGRTEERLIQRRQVLQLLNPDAPLQRGYAIIRTEKEGVIRSVKQLQVSQVVDLQMGDGSAAATIDNISKE